MKSAKSRHSAQVPGLSVLPAQPSTARSPARLVCGAAVGVGTVLVLRGAPARSLQVVLAFGAAAAFAVAWAAALRGG